MWLMKSILVSFRLKRSSLLASESSLRGGATWADRWGSGTGLSHIRFRLSKKLNLSQSTSQGSLIKLSGSFCSSMGLFQSYIKPLSLSFWFNTNLLQLFKKIAQVIFAVWSGIFDFSLSFYWINTENKIRCKKIVSTTNYLFIKVTVIC